MFSIGEFSKISGFSIKALRLYHENGVLIPKIVDPETGYRYYDFNNVERARIVGNLRDMMFSLEEIREILKDNDDSDVLRFLETHRAKLNAKLREVKRAAAAVDRLIRSEQEANTLFDDVSNLPHEVELPSLTIASVRIRGKYSEMGAAFGMLGKSLGSLISGKPLTLFYDDEYKELDADFECCFPVKRAKHVAGVGFRELLGGRALTLAHKGAYDQLGRSYAKLFAFANERGLKLDHPTREVYLKGPGMIFKGAPKNYVTQIQGILV